MNEKDMVQEYVVYYYVNNGIGLTSKLNKNCFESEDELKEFLKSSSFTQIDNIYINGKQANYNIETKVEVFIV